MDVFVGGALRFAVALGLVGQYVDTVGGGALDTFLGGGLNFLIGSEPFAYKQKSPTIRSER